MVGTRTRSPLAVMLVTAVLAGLIAALVLSFVLEDDDQIDGDATVLTLAPDGGTAPQVDLAGEPAPDFTYEPLAGGTDVDFATFRASRPAVINFFAEWCAPCVREMPTFEAAHQEHGDRVAFLGLSYNETAEDGLALVERTGVTYETGRDPDGAIITAFSGLGMPTTIFIAADGTITTSHTGPLTAGELEEELEELEGS